MLVSSKAFLLCVKILLAAEWSSLGRRRVVGCKASSVRAVPHVSGGGRENGARLRDAQKRELIRLGHSMNIGR